MSTTINALKPGDFCWCRYPDLLNNSDLELFWCKIILMNDQYATCELYRDEDETITPTKRVGMFDNVCIGDLEEPSKEFKSSVKR
jgi:hypothetical protein